MENKVIKRRYGRLNITQFLSDKTLRKIAIVKEEKRPYRLKVEKWALEEARCRQVNVPIVLNYYVNDKGNETLLLVQINGTHLANLSLNSKCDALKSVGIQMLKLKSSLAGFGWINLETMQGEYTDWQGFLYKIFEIYGGNLYRYGMLSKNDLLNIKFALNSIDLPLKEPCLVHRDIKLGNIIRDMEGKAWIVDWENVILGDPLFDLAQFGANYGHATLFEALSDGYGLTGNNFKNSIYEILILLGVIDFCYKYRVNYERRLINLKHEINKL